MNKQQQESIIKYRALLEEHHDWPSKYMFKFICPVAKIEQARELFKTFRPSERESRKGNYISITFVIEAKSSQEIIDIYIQAQEVEGLLKL